MIADIHFIIGLGLIAFAGYVVIQFIINYRKTTDATLTARLITAAENSATILWQQFVMLIASITGALAALANYLGDPTLANAIQQVLKPEYVALFTLVVAFVTVWARQRTLKK